MLELRHLHMLKALVESGNLSRAAQRLHLTQSAISHQVKQIEDHYGVPVFERKTQPLRLTVTGRRLHALAETVLAQVAEAERDIARILEGQAGRLRVAVECHTCFEWLMPAMDIFREHWSEIELDLVSGFHADPLALLREDRADLVVVSEHRNHAANGVVYHPLFGFEIIGIVSRLHRLAQKEYLTPQDFTDETLVTYPVPEEMLDVIRIFLKPHGVEPKRRTAELTVAILQLVASRRGISAMPNWAVQGYLKTGYVQGLRLGKEGLFSELYAVTHGDAAKAAYMQDFLETVRAVSFNTLPGLIPLSPA